MNNTQIMHSDFWGQCRWYLIFSRDPQGLSWSWVPRIIMDCIFHNYVNAQIQQPWTWGAVYVCIYYLQGVPCPRRPGLGWLRFGEFPWLVGRYCSCLLPKQGGGTSQIQVNKTQSTRTRDALFSWNVIAFYYLLFHARWSNILYWG